MGGHARTRHARAHTREKPFKQTSLAGLRKHQDQQSPKPDLSARLTNHGGYECATGACVVKPNERMKPQAQTTLRSPTDIMAHAGGDATTAVWQFHGSQSEPDHVTDVLRAMPMQQLQSCVVAPCPQTLAGMTWRATGHTHVYSTRHCNIPYVSRTPKPWELPSRRLEHACSNV